MYLNSLLDLLKHPFLREARQERIEALSTEFQESAKQRIVVSDEDARKVMFIFFSIVRLLHVRINYRHSRLQN